MNVRTGAAVASRQRRSSEPLTWGRRYLMCPPEAFGVSYEINPWMHKSVPVDRERAREQWDDLAANVRAAGATVERMEPVEGLPDLVFTANAGMAWDGRFVPSRFRHRERQGESPHDVAWFDAKGFDVHALPGHGPWEGTGDALPMGDAILGGYGPRSDPEAQRALGDVLGVRVVPVQLVDDRFYHLDLTFCPLDERRAIVVPSAYDRRSARTVEKLVPEPLVVEQPDAVTFCANSIVAGTTIIMPSCPPRVGRQLERWGYDVCVSPVDEFLKAGGGVRCLTLPLDMGPAYPPRNRARWAAKRSLTAPAVRPNSSNE